MTNWSYATTLNPVLNNTQDVQNGACNFFQICSLYSETRYTQKSIVARYIIQIRISRSHEGSGISAKFFSTRPSCRRIHHAADSVAKIFLENSYRYRSIVSPSDPE